MNDNKSISLVGSVLSALVSGYWLINARPVLAHHPSGGAVPDTLMAGLMSGFGHPVIGIDHLVFVIAVGLLAITSKKLGMIIPVAFVAATALGTLVHLQSISLPSELIISASILVAGIFLAREERGNPLLLAIIIAIAGIFHGYAYGESIVGAETTALGAYLLGFCTIQLVISAIAFTIGKWLVEHSDRSSLWLRFAGFAICGVGFAFFSDLVLSQF